MNLRRVRREDGDAQISAAYVTPDTMAEARNNHGMRWIFLFAFPTDGSQKRARDHTILSSPGLRTNEDPRILVSTPYGRLQICRGTARLEYRTIVISQSPSFLYEAPARPRHLAVDSPSPELQPTGFVAAPLDEAPRHHRPGSRRGGEEC